MKPASLNLLAPILVLLCFVLVFFFGTYQLVESPPTWYDEGMLIQLALTPVTHGELGMRIAPGVVTSGAYVSSGFPVLAPITLAFKLIGPTLQVARGVMVAFLMLFIALAWAFSRRLFGMWPAVAGMVLVATHASLYAYGKNVLGEVPGLVYLLSCFFLLFAGEQMKKRTVPEWRVTGWGALLGLMAGLTLMAKPIFLLVLPALLLTLWLFHARLPLSRNAVIAGVLAALAMVGIWAGTQFAAGDNFTTIFLFYRNPYLLSTIPQVIGTNLLRFAKEFTAIYLLGGMLLWTVSLGLRFRAKETLTSAEVCAWLFSGLVLAAYLRTPGLYRYFFLAQMLVLLALPFSLWDVLRRLGKRVKALPAPHLVTAGIVTLLVAFHFFRLVNGSFITTTYGSRQTAVLHGYFERFDRTQSVYLYDAPELALFLPYTPYFQWIEMNGHGQFAVGIPREEILAQGVDVILLNEKRWRVEQELFPGYQKREHVERYVVLERAP